MRKKRCSKCGRVLPATKFYKNRAKKDGLQSYCHDCAHRRRVQYYKENRVCEDKRNREAYKRYQERYQRYKEKCVCEVCGESRWYVLDFHHDGDDKTEHIGALVARQRSWAAVVAEIQKCRVLCANCHRALHYEDGTRGKYG